MKFIDSLILISAGLSIIIGLLFFNYAIQGNNFSLPHWKICQGSECWYTDFFKKASSSISFEPESLYKQAWNVSTTIFGDYSISNISNEK